MIKNRVYLVIITMLTLTILFGCEKKLDYEKYDVYVEVGIKTWFQDNYF